MLNELLLLFSMQFERPWMFYGLPVIVILLILLLRKDFVKLRDLSAEDMSKQRRRLFWGRLLLFFSRLIIFSALIVALAGPYVETNTLVEGNPRVTVVMDKSSSMQIFDDSQVEPLLESLRQHVPVEVYTFGTPDSSIIGDSIITHVTENTPLLLISDGQSTGGMPLESVAQYAASLNSSLSLLELPAKANDVHVTIDGPSKTLEDVENNFVASVVMQSPTSFRLTVELDGKNIVDQQYTASDGQTLVEFPFSATFHEGNHALKATLTLQNPDVFSVNNEFYKTIHVIKKPKILFVSESNNPAATLLKQIYEVTMLNTLPTDLSPYGAVVVHDLHGEKITQQQVDRLSDFLNEGNGLVALGGLNSFDLGKYDESPFGSLLPVQIGSGEEKESDSSVIILIDISKSTKSSFKGGTKVTTSDVIKAQVISMLDTLKKDDDVGVIAFNDRAFLVSPLSPLGDKEAELVDKVARLRFANTTYMNIGLMASYQILKEVSGSKSIVVLSDGKVSGYPKETLALASKLAEGNIHVYAVSVGSHTDSAFMKELAKRGNGIFFEPNEFQKLKILFGEPELLKTEGKSALIILNSDHFITRNLELNAKMGAYNSIVPKSAASVLVTLDTGEPALTTWRYGLGRVAAVNVFTTNNDLGPLLNAENSKLITRIVNWAIGDPERNSEYFVSVPDTAVGVESFVRVRSEKVPEAPELQFYREGPNEYASNFVPLSQGIFSVLTTTYAVNAAPEYQRTGISDEIYDAVADSNGDVFTADEAERIVEFLRAQSRRVQIERVSYVYLALYVVLATFLLEVMVRRIYEVWIRGR